MLQLPLPPARAASLLAQAVLRVRGLEFNPDQPRDDAGRWTGSGYSDVAKTGLAGIKKRGTKVNDPTDTMFILKDGTRMGSKEKPWSFHAELTGGGDELEAVLAETGTIRYVAYRGSVAVHVGGQITERQATMIEEDAEEMGVDTVHVDVAYGRPFAYGRPSERHVWGGKVRAQARSIRAFIADALQGRHEPRAAEFDPDQPRDERGRWIAVGSGFEVQLGDSDEEDRETINALRRGTGTKVAVRRGPTGVTLRITPSVEADVPEWRERTIARMRARGLAFNPDQPRDERGRWTDGGSDPAAEREAQEKLAAAQTHPLAKPDFVFGHEMRVPQQDLNRYVAAYGQEFKAQDLPDEYQKGPDRQCYRNASLLVMENPDLDYAEGFAKTKSTGDLVFMHAWAVDKAGNVVDNTWRNPKDSQYFGVRYERSAYLKYLLKAQIYGVLGSTHKNVRKALDTGVPKLRGLEFNPDQPRDERGRWTDGGASERASRAVETYKPSTRAKQQEAARSVRTLANILGGKATEGNHPVDVLVRRGGKLHAVEVKTLLDNANDKITMHPESLARKEAFVRAEKAVGHTLVVDKRGNRSVYYYRSGFGSFRVNAMSRISKSDVDQLLRANEDRQMSYYLYDANGYIADGPSSLGLERFARWAEGIDAVEKFVEDGFTKNPAALADALEAEETFLKPIDDVRRTLAAAARKATGVLIITDVPGEDLGDLRTLFDPDQPRDERGRWTDGGGDSADDAKIPVDEQGRTPAEVKHADLLVEAERRVAQSLAQNGDTFHRFRSVDGTWTPERAALHDELINAALRNAPAGLEHPTAILMGGLPGSGKSTVVGDIDAKDYVTVNADDFKEKLPEYRGTNAGELHEESSYLAELLFHTAIERKQNIILDGTLKTSGSTNDGGALGKARSLKEAGYRVEARFVDVDVEHAVERAVLRFASRELKSGDGRFVPPSFIRSTGYKPRESYNRLKESGLLDSWMMMDNRGKKPKLIERKA